MKKARHLIDATLLNFKLISAQHINYTNRIQSAKSESVKASTSEPFSVDACRVDAAETGTDPSEDFGAEATLKELDVLTAAGRTC
jgi:hypothetical protein